MFRQAQAENVLFMCPTTETSQSTSLHTGLDNTTNDLSSFYSIKDGEELTDLCSLTSLDGYSTIDQRDKECKYKTGDGSVDLTEREPLKVRADLLWSPQGSGHGG